MRTTSERSRYGYSKLLLCVLLASCKRVPSPMEACRNGLQLELADAERANDKATIWRVRQLITTGKGCSHLYVIEESVR